MASKDAFRPMIVMPLHGVSLREQAGNTAANRRERRARQVTGRNTLQGVTGRRDGQQPKRKGNTMLNNQELGQALAACPAERVTKEYIETRVKETTFTRFSETVTICQITLDNGYSVRGESACVNPENYNQEIGERIAHDNAFNKLWPLFGFLLAEYNLRSKIIGDAQKGTTDDLDD